MVSVCGPAPFWRGWYPCTCCGPGSTLPGTSPPQCSPVLRQQGCRPAPGMLAEVDQSLQQYPLALASGQDWLPSATAATRCSSPVLQPGERPDGSSLIMLLPASAWRVDCSQYARRTYIDAAGPTVVANHAEGRSNVVNFVISQRMLSSRVRSPYSAHRASKPLNHRASWVHGMPVAVQSNPVRRSCCYSGKSVLYTHAD